MTDDSHSSARILDVRPIRVREELDRGRVVVLAGFQGVNPATREITTRRMPQILRSPPSACGPFAC
jgi:aspartate kinase